jgi:hypothetical protein
MSPTRSLCTFGMLQKNWPECWKSCATHENVGPFSWKRTCKLFWPGDIPLVLLCNKLWSVRGGGTVRVTKCVIPASVWASNSRFQRHLNGLKKARNVYPRSKHYWKPRQMSSQGICAHPGCCKKIDLSVENCVLWPTKMAWNGHFRDYAPANPSGPETYPCYCYALNYGRYMEEGPLEWRNASFRLLFE